MPAIVQKLTIKTGKNAGRHPSVASLYRALDDADSDQQQVPQPVGTR